MSVIDPKQLYRRVEFGVKEWPLTSQTVTPVPVAVYGITQKNKLVGLFSVGAEGDFGYRSIVSSVKSEGRKGFS